MPKKFDTNTKSAEARARKEAVKQANDREKQQRLEDEYWKDDDKQVQKKQQRKEDREKKDLEKLQRKQENQKLLEEEQATLLASKSKKNEDLAPKKVTRTEIQERQLAAAASAATANTATNANTRVVNAEPVPIEENVNRLKIEGASARTVDEAIVVLGSNETADGDSHPEKRMKAAYQTFEDENLPRIKQENPSLRLSQLKQILKKEWMKSPSNPFNKPTKPFNQSNQIKEDDSDSDQD